MPPALVRAPGDPPGRDQDGGRAPGDAALRRGRREGADDMEPVARYELEESLEFLAVERLLEKLVGGRLSEEVVLWIPAR